MRITFNTSTTETLEYLRMVNSILRNNRSVEDEAKAYHALKDMVEDLGKRLHELESERRNRVCR